MYAFSARSSLTYSEAIEAVKKALQEQGFGVLTEIDVSATMKKKLDVDRRPYIILGACNPSLANQALDAEPDMGLLLPCNVVVREEEDGATTVAFMDPVAVLGLVSDPAIGELAGQVRTRLESVRDTIAG
jgi:uncharacterized protein (DUF302 family)